MLFRYWNFCSSLDNIFILPFISIHLVSKTISFISPPCAPAFILIAPPIEPGIPAANSNPSISSINNFCATKPFFTPAPTVIIYSSLIFSILKSCISILKTIPLIPPSFTNRLLPFPITVIGVSFLFAYSNMLFISCSFLVFTNISAFPPTLNEVCFDINSFLYIFDSFDIHFSNSLEVFSIFKLIPLL